MLPQATFKSQMVTSCHFSSQICYTTLQHVTNRHKSSRLCYNTLQTRYNKLQTVTFCYIDTHISSGLCQRHARAVLVTTLYLSSYPALPVRGSGPPVSALVSF